MPVYEPIPSFGRLGCTLRVRLKDRLHHPYGRAHWPGVIAVDRMSRDELLGLQSARFGALIQHAATHVPFYKRWASESGYRPGDPVEPGDLPTVTKNEYANPEDFQSDAYPESEMMSNKTSGSSGQPFRFRQHAWGTDYSYCVLWRALLRFGLRPGHRRAFIWGRSYSFNASGPEQLRTRLKLAVRDWANSTLSIDAYSLGVNRAGQVCERINAYRPVYIHGYVSAIYTLARHILDTKQNLSFTPRLIITESEAIYPFQRNAIEKAFRCPVIANYGSVELGKIAQPDPDGNMRINEDIFVVERAENGEAVITGLFSHAFPFIRYRLGDLIEFDDEIKPGLPYRSLKEIVGRTVDMIPVPAGGFVHGVALAHLIDPHLDHVLKYQIHQTQLDRFVVRLVTKSPLPEASKATIRKDLAGLVGQSARIEIEEVDHIEPASSGKFRWVMSDLNMNQHQPSPG